MQNLKSSYIFLQTLHNDERLDILILEIFESLIKWLTEQSTNIIFIFGLLGRQEQNEGFVCDDGLDTT